MTPLTIKPSNWIRKAAVKLGVSVEDFILDAAHTRACEVHTGSNISQKKQDQLVEDYKYNNLSFFELKEKYRLGSVQDVYNILIAQEDLSLFSINGFPLEGSSTDNIRKCLGEDRVKTLNTNGLVVDSFGEAVNYILANS